MFCGVMTRKASTQLRAMGRGRGRKSQNSPQGGEEDNDVEVIDQQPQQDQQGDDHHQHVRETVEKVVHDAVETASKLTEDQKHRLEALQAAVAQKMDEISAKLQPLRDQLHELQKEIVAKLEEFRPLIEGKVQAAKDVVAAWQKDAVAKVDMVKAQMEPLMKQLQQMKDDVSHVSRLSSEISTRYESLHSAASDAVSKVVSLKDDVLARLEPLVERTKLNFESIEKQLHQTVSASLKRLSELSSQLQPILEQIHQMRTEGIAKRCNEVYRPQIEAKVDIMVKQLKEDAAARIEALKKQAEEIMKQMQQLRDDLVAKAKEVQAMTKEQRIEAVKDTVASISAEFHQRYDAMKPRLETVKAQLGQLKDDVWAKIDAYRPEIEKRIADAKDHFDRIVPPMPDAKEKCDDAVCETFLFLIVARILTAVALFCLFLLHRVLSDGKVKKIGSLGAAVAAEAAAVGRKVGVVGTVEKMVEMTPGNKLLKRSFTILRLLIRRVHQNIQ